jgi:hypothetical protein
MSDLHAKLFGSQHLSGRYQGIGTICIRRIWCALCIHLKVEVGAFWQPWKWHFNWMLHLWTVPVDNYKPVKRVSKPIDNARCAFAEYALHSAQSCQWLGHLSAGLWSQAKSSSGIRQDRTTSKLMTVEPIWSYLSCSKVCDDQDSFVQCSVLSHRPVNKQWVHTSARMRFKTCMHSIRGIE